MSDRTSPHVRFGSTATEAKLTMPVGDLTDTDPLREAISLVHATATMAAALWTSSDEKLRERSQSQHGCECSV